jgi:COP9 signalosome complex subunit 3
MHVDFLKLCIQSGEYKEALPIIDKVIHSFPSQFSHGLDGKLPCSNHQDSSGYITLSSGLTAKVEVRDVQEYYLLAAFACIGIGMTKWPDALLFLEMVLLTPNQGAVTGFTLEAYRKWLILNLLVHGKSVDLPKALNGYAYRLLKSAVLPYTALVQAFHSGEPKKLYEEIQVGLEVWQAVSGIRIRVQY